MVQPQKNPATKAIVLRNQIGLDGQTGSTENKVPIGLVKTPKITQIDQKPIKTQNWMQK